MGVIQIELPESVLLATGQSREEFVQEARFFIALKLFELSRISSGQAAEICGLPRIDFLLKAGRMGIPVADLDESELSREFEDLDVILERRDEPSTSHEDFLAELKRDGLL